MVMEMLRAMAHPSASQTLTEYERSVLLSALRHYQLDCTINVRRVRSARPLVYSPAIRAGMDDNWSRRAETASFLHSLILRDDDNHTRVTVTW